MAISKEVVDTTQNYLSKYPEIFSTYPVEIKSIIHNENITLQSRDFEDEISGVLLIKEDNVTIGVKSGSHQHRERFTIAHELGHYILHTDKSNLFIDKIFFRKKSDGYTTKEEKIEKEANYFAANILMPEKLVLQAILNLDCDLYDDIAIDDLAKEFNVSSSAMSFRLINLGIL